MLQLPRAGHFPSEETALCIKASLLWQRKGQIVFLPGCPPTSICGTRHREGGGHKAGPSGCSLPDSGLFRKASCGGEQLAFLPVSQPGSPQIPSGGAFP